MKNWEIVGIYIAGMCSGAAVACFIVAEYFETLILLKII